MVATFHVISAASSGGRANDGSYYTATVCANYYQEGGDREGQWCGEGARLLGLQGGVEADDLRSVLQGLKPKTDQPLRHSTRSQKHRGQTQTHPNRCAAFDITFSVPSTVATLLACADRPLRGQIIHAVESAARTTLRSVEKHLPLARRGRAGATQEHAKLVAAMFTHMTNRNLDPNPHVHCVISNICQRNDGTWVAVNTKMLAQWTRTIGPLFRAALAQELRNLDLQLVQPQSDRGTPKPWFEIEGVPTELAKKWSSRRAEIMQAVGARGLSHSASAKARANANLATRQSKQRTPPEAELIAKWQSQAAPYSFVPEKLVGTQQSVEPQSFDLAYHKAWNSALHNITQEHSHFSYREVVQNIAEQLQTVGADPNELLQRVRVDLAESRDIVVLNSHEGRQRYTTREMWQLEEKMLATTDQLQNTPGAQVASSTLRKTLAKYPSISAEQSDAVEHLVQGRGALRVLSGVAGAGKSYSLNVVREAFEKSGYRVIGGAISGAAKEELASSANLQSRTIASYLYHFDKSTSHRLKDRFRHDARQLLRALRHKTTYRHQRVKLDDKTVLVLDEAGMIDTRTMTRLLEEARNANATIILTGDDEQLQPILAGGPLRHIKARYEHYHMAENRRQQDPEDKRAVAQLREGQVASTLEHYERRERLVVAKDRTQAIDQLVDCWAKQGGLTKPEDHLILTMTREEARSVNRICQQRRQAASILPQIASVATKNEQFYAGDRVLFHVPLRRLGIENGYRGTVVCVHPLRNAITVKLDKQSMSHTRNSRDSAYVTVSLKTLPENAVTLGFVATTHKMQGQTCRQSYVLLGGSMTHRELAYVQLSRAREATYLFTDELHAGKELEDIKKALARSRAKTLAHDVAEDDDKRPQMTHQLEHDLSQSPRASCDG